MRAEGQVGTRRRGKELEKTCSSKCECGTIYSMWIILRKYEGGLQGTLSEKVKKELV